MSTDYAGFVVHQPAVLTWPGVQDRELDMATIEDLHASLAGLHVKLEHVGKAVDASVQREEDLRREVRELRDRLIVLETQRETNEQAEERAEEAERWQRIEQWLIRIGAAVGTLGAAASATGII